jgi:hypothetical protein
MRELAELVFGWESYETGETRDERLCGGHPAPAGDWCQTQPGHAALGWLGVAHGTRESKRDGSRRAPFGMRIF